MPRTSNKKGVSGSGSIRQVRKDKNGKEYTYWEGRLTTGYDPSTGKQKQRAINGKTQKEVAQKLRQLSADLDAGTYNEPSKLTVSEWLDECHSSYLGNVKPSTAYLYGREIELHIKPGIAR